MAFTLLVNSVDRSDEVAEVEYTGEQNERSTLRFSTEPGGFEPGLRQEVLYYEQDETTAVFGGVIFTRACRGLAENTDAAVFACDCADWNYYLDRILIDGGVLTGTITLKAALEWVMTFLSGHGFTLDAAQEVGPSYTVTGFAWERKTANGIFQDLTVWSGGWVRTMSPTKVIRFVKANLASPDAPFAITATTTRARVVEWTESSERYATRVEVIWGGTGTREKTDSFEIDAQIVSDGYYETELPSVPTAGVSATINAVAATIGAVGSGAQLGWDWATHRVYAGTYTPVLGDDLTITYTAQYPGTTIVNGSGSPTLALPPVQKDDIVDAATALAYANGLIAQHNQDVREYAIEVVDEGLKPGQVLSIDLASRFASSQTAQIVGVTETPGPGTFWRYAVRAISGVYQGSPLDFWRGAGGGGATGPTIVTVTTTPGTNPSVVAVPPIYLGGSRNTAIAVVSPAYTPVVGYVPFVATWAFSGRVRVWLWARNAGISATARLYDETAAAAAGTSSPVTAQTPTERTFDVTITAGHTYRLDVLSSAASEAIYGIGLLEWVG